MRRLIPLAALALGLAGCGGGSVTTPFPETVIGKVKGGVSGSAAGKALFAANGCGSCHTYKPAASNGKVGPDLDKLAADAQKAHRGALDAYVKESIENPDAYVVPGFSKGVMPPFQGKLTDSQIDDLVKFLTNP
jgi:mono/diheme cytochrome c family protein